MRTAGSIVVVLFYLGRLLKNDDFMNIKWTLSEEALLL